MPFESKLTLQAECETCGRRETKIYYGDEFGVSVDDVTEIPDFLFDLNFNYGWEVNRISYEESEFYCPDCKAKRAAA
jgi:Zn finger protein HypA/HybF involved in hydrogenase expression